MSKRPLSAPTKKPVTLAPIRPNLGVEVAFQTRLEALIARMNRDVSRQILSAYRRKPPEMAQDASPAATLRALIRGLASDWSKRFSEFGAKWGTRFARDAAGAADRSFASALKRAGFTVSFKMSPAANDVLQASIGEQVNLIKSIPQEYLVDVQGAVMRSVQTGRDIGSLSAELQASYGVSKRRAALIARDQNNKSTAAITRVRQDELGITEAIWLHSAGGRTPRPTHVANSGKRYSIRDGWLDPASQKKIWPGTEINCRCVSKSLIPGL